MSGEKPVTVDDLGRRLEALRKTLDETLTRWDLVWILAEEAVFGEWRGDGSILDAADRAEAKVLARAAGLEDLRRVVARTKRLQRLGARIDRGDFDALKPKRRRKRKAVR